MSLLLAVDPGVTCPGWAVFDIESKQLLRAGYVQGPGFRMQPGHLVKLAEDVIHAAAEWAKGPEGFHRLVVEWMVPRKRGPKNAHDLIAVAGFTGVLIGEMDHMWCSEPHIVKPEDWKHQKKGNPTARWVLGKLSSTELTAIEHIDAIVLQLIVAADEPGDPDIKHLGHNTLDAVGIGLHHLGRLTKKRVIAR